MSTFTVFFCGTGSNSFDFAHTNFHQGELISTLARNHSGHEFVDWIIVDGPGSDNLQEAEKWVPSKNYFKKRGALQGKGWEENVQHAVAVLLAGEFDERTTHTRKEKKRLKAAGVGVREVPGRLWGTRTVQDLHPRISPQALQQKKIEILGHSKTFDQINAIGWSRGAVTCHMFANALAETQEWADVPVNIFACDPVPGQGKFQKHRIKLQKNVANYVAIYARHERSRGFSPILPLIHHSTTTFITTIPGRHATLVGNASVDGGSGFNALFSPGRVTRDLAEKYLTVWGTTLAKRLQLPANELLKLYDTMLGNKGLYEAMTDISYTYFTQKQQRSVGLGNGTFSNFSDQAVLQLNRYFVNDHHEALFSEI